MNQFIRCHVDKVVRDTKTALLLQIEGYLFWMPHSQVENPGSLAPGDCDREILVTRAMASQKGLPAWG